MAKILIVDDRPTNRQLLLTLLGYVAHEMLEAADGVEALRQVRLHRPDLVITDMLMPTMSGYEFVLHLRADPELKSTPVIFYTASYSEPHAQQLAKACGVEMVLRKPCEPEQILDAVNLALKLQQPAHVPPAARQRVAVANREAMLAESMLADYLRDLNAVRRGFTELIELGSHSPLEHAQKEELSGMFSRTIAGLTLMTARLSALVQAGLDLLNERDPGQIVRHCFDAACRVIGSSQAAIGMFDETGALLRFVFTKGIDPQVFGSQAGRELPLLADILERHDAIRERAAPGSHLAGFVAPHPPVNSFLGVPIATADKIYGWMYFTNRLGAEEFTDEDQRVAATLSLQLALLHENFLLYDLLQNHAVRLQLEVAERRHAEQQLLQLNESLEARVAERTAELQLANKELEAYSYSVSHDLSAPLRAISGFTRLLMRDHLGSGDAVDERRTFLQHIDTSVLRATEIIDGLLRLATFSRQALDNATIDVAALANEAVVQLRLQSVGRAVDVQIQLLPQCIGDAVMIKQLLVNLLSNAFKFTRRQTDPKIVVGWQPQAGAYFVADNGVGFNANHAEKLFMPFRRDHAATEFEGTGIGLSIVQRVVQRHGGRVWAESASGQGATFYFTLG